jgi:hypothetical protein
MGVALLRDGKVIDVIVTEMNWHQLPLRDGFSGAMPQSMTIPAEWMVEANVQKFQSGQRGFRCDAPHEIILPLADIEVPLRRTGYPLDR